MARKDKNKSSDKLKSVQKNLTALEVGLHDLRQPERDVRRVRKNLSKFLTRAQKPASGHPHMIPR
jgi:hypothetical protein